MPNVATRVLVILLVASPSFTQTASENSTYQPNATSEQRAAVEDLKRRAEAGPAEAENELSKQYMEGKILKPDVPQAVKWVRAAAEQGLAEAQVNLAILYLEGRGVARDYTLGFSWMQKAANQDNPKAAYNLGMLYGLGRGVTQNIALGVQWYLKAAENGNPAGAYKMGMACQQGVTVPQDSVKAYMWYYIAASRYGYTPRPDVLRELGAKIGAKGIEEARRQAEVWIKAHPKQYPGPYEAP